MSIADAARVTKIRPRQIADLEADEYSNFANLAYARSFLVGYAKYLHVDLGPYLEAFEDASTFGMDDYQYLSETPVGVFRAPTRRFRRRKRRGRLLAALTTLGVLAVAATSWFLVVSYHRLGNLDELVARQEARERAARQGINPAADAKAVEAVFNGREPAAPAPGDAIPVSAPVSQSPTPAAPVPLNDKAITAPAALAAAESTNSVPVGSLAIPAERRLPAVPLPGDGTATRALTQGTDLRTALAGVPTGLLGDQDGSAAGAQAKIRAAKPGFDPSKRPADPYQGNVPQPVSNNSVR